MTFAISRSAARSHGRGRNPGRLDGQRLTFENNSAGVNSDTLMTLSLRCVALSVTPVAARMYPAKHRRKTSVMD